MKYLLELLKNSVYARVMKILIVDDSRICRAMVIQDLKLMPELEIIEASSGEEAISLTLSEKPELITMDIEMGQMSGIQAASKIRRNPECSHIPIIMISASTDITTKQLAFDAGANIFFTKPFEPGKLFKYIQELTIKNNIFDGLTILVVEDSKVMRALISHTLAAKSATIIEATDGLAALDILANQHVDLIITDLLMPGMDGIDLTIQIRKDLALEDIPIILLTAVADQSIQIEALRAGSDDFLLKPFSREELLARINNHYRRIKAARLMNEHLYNVQKMEEVGLLLSGVMHDVNNALGNIGLLAELAQYDLSNQSKVNSELSNIQDEVMRGAQLIKQLLSFSHQDKDCDDKRECFLLAAVIKDVLSLFALSKLGDIQLSIDTMDDTLLIQGSKARIAQLFLNLLNNAKFALKQQSEPMISITTNRIDKGANMSSNEGSFLAEKAMVHIAVRDNGCGIPASNLQDIFKPFFTTKGVDEGTGLGLAMIRRSIAEHHGSIHVESDLGIGTCFHIYLPLKTTQES
ncbi:MAG: response regulator [Mariprofundus sp.]|nr:response regulator [Mariprofundus sp.]